MTDRDHVAHDPASTTRRRGDAPTAIPRQRARMASPPPPPPTPPAARTAVPPPSRPPRAARTSAPTRRLCTLVYVEQGLRDAVHEHFPTWRARAWAPCYGIDLIALLRHTRRAARLSNLRDAALTALLVAATAYVTLLWFDPRLGGLLVVLAVATTIGVTGWVMRGRELSAAAAVRRFLRYARRRLKQLAHRAALVVLLLPVPVLIVAGHRASRLTLLAVAVALAGGWLIVTVFSVVAFVQASFVRTAEDIAGLGARLPAATEQRAADISDANVLIYARERAREVLGPFVGAGQRLTRWTSEPVNVTVGKDKEVPPRPVDVVELHRTLAEAVEGLALPHTLCRHRVYVDGRSAADLRPFRVGPRDTPPLTGIPDDDVLVRVAHPEKYQRGYLCLQAEEPDGDVVVTIFVRAIREGERLQVEVSVHALPELTWPRQEPELIPITVGRPERKPRPVDVPPPHRLHAVWKGVVAGYRSYWPTMFAAAGRTMLLLLAPAARAGVRWRDRRGMERQDFDFGAETSLREHLAMNQKLHYNAIVDMLAQADRLQRRVVDTVAAYLEAAGIDSADFTRQSVTAIVTHQQNFINTLNAHGVTFGNNSPVNPPGPPPPQPGAQQQPPPHQERT